MHHTHTHTHKYPVQTHPSHLFTVLKIIKLQTEMTAIVNKAVTEKQVLHDEIGGEEYTLSYTTAHAGHISQLLLVPQMSSHSTTYSSRSKDGAHRLQRREEQTDPHHNR